MQAADSRNKDVVELLLKYGADTNSINHKLCVFSLRYRTNQFIKNL